MTDPRLTPISASLASISRRLARIDRLLTVGIWIVGISTAGLVAMLGYCLAVFGLPG